MLPRARPQPRPSHPPGLGPESRRLLPEPRGLQQPLYRYDPRNDTPLTLDSPQIAPDTFPAFINNQDRYADLRLVDPADAPTLQSALCKRCVKVHELLGGV